MRTSKTVRGVLVRVASMETKDQIETIRQACIKANPEIVELKFGCEGIWHKGESDESKAKDFSAVVLANVGPLYLYTYEPHLKGAKNLSYHTITIFESDFEIIGRPIRLADVLLAMSKTQGLVLTDFRIEYDGSFFKRQNNGSYLKVCQYNLLNDDITQQSSQFIDFIAELLHV